MKRYKIYYLSVIYESCFGNKVEEIADVKAYSLADALRKYQMYLLPYGAQMKYARERM